MTTADTNSPAWVDPAFAKWAPQRLRLRDVLEGTDAVQAKGQTYLKRLPRETPQNYEVRRTVAEVVNLLAGAVRAAEGLMIAEPPTLIDEVSPAMHALWANIDGRQTGGVVWLRGVLRGMLTDGWQLAVVASPVKAGAATTLSEEAANSLRPYVTLYHADDVMGRPRFTRVGGSMRLSQLVLRERVTEPSGAFGASETVQYRVLRRITEGAHTSQTYRANARGDVVPFGPVEQLETRELPVVEFSANPEQGFGAAPPTLLDLADLTLAHYRISADRRWAMKQSCFPWLVRIGFIDDGATTVGPTEALDLPAGGDAKFITPGSEAFGPTRDELTDIERRAAALSLSFLSGEPASKRGQTATAAAIDQQSQDASLAGLAVSLRDALNQLGALLAEMLGETPRDEYFIVNTAFRGLVRDPVYLRLLVEAWKEGGLPLDAMLHAIKHGELPDAFDAFDEAARAMAEAEARDAAVAERQRDQAGQGGDAVDVTPE